MKIAVASLLIVGLVAASATGVEAANHKKSVIHRNNDGYISGYYPNQKVYEQTQRRVCTKMCPNDTLPCDPVSFKIADGRCLDW